MDECTCRMCGGFVEAWDQDSVCWLCTVELDNGYHDPEPLTRAEREMADNVAMDAYPCGIPCGIPGGRTNG